jgi:hypothetical protein
LPQDEGAAVEDLLIGTARRSVERVGQHGGEARCFGGRQTCRGFAEIMLGRGFGAIDAGSPLDDIEVDLDDPLLAPGELDQRSEIGLECLAQPVAGRSQEHVFGGLHRDRAGA